jgi:mannose-6-phosphate isomerase-like protein (cupin superfamily)
MGLNDEGFELLLPDARHWRESNIMKIPNTNLLQDFGGGGLGGRLWRLPPFSANTWHKHVESWELYFLLEGIGKMRIGEKRVIVPKYGSVLVAPHVLRQVYNDTLEDSLWLIVSAPLDAPAGVEVDRALIYPEDPKSLPSELAGRSWPPK